MNLEKNKKYNLSLKIFLYLSIFTYTFIGIFFSVNNIYLKEYQLEKKKIQLIQLSEIQRKKDPKEFSQILTEERVLLRETTLKKMKNSNLLKGILVKLEEKRHFLDILGEDNKKILVFMKVDKNDNVTVFSTPLSKVDIAVSDHLRFYLILILLSVPVNIIISYFISRKMSRPIEKELRELNEQLKEELENEKRLDEFRKRFIANITHELKTPVAIITGYSDAIIDKVIENDEIIEVSRTINLEATNMDKLIRELLFYSKLESKYIELNKEEISVVEVVENLLKRYSLDININNLNILKNYQDIQIKVDRKLFERALNNILINAISYVDKRKTIEIEIKNNRIIIRNSFENINDLSLEDYFIPFNRNKKNQKQKYGGTGLGLSIVGEIFNVLKYKYLFNYNYEKEMVEFIIKFKQE